MGSKKFTLDLSDLGGLGKQALLIGGAAAVTYIIQNLGTLDLGSMGALLVPIIAVTLDAIIKWFKNNQKDEDKE